MASMREEDGQSQIREDTFRCTAEDEIPGSRMSETAHCQEVSTRLDRGLLQGFSHSSASERNVACLGDEAALHQQGGKCLGDVLSGEGLFISHRENGDPAVTGQKGYEVRNRPGSDSARIPGYRYMFDRF